ncbi:uncharacterized protein LOC660485 [Tribolium castaneum]|uniref:Uncharacterized protein n=1 Tax=Tribolium castaneum TaxID=7070 RepID=D2A568_TRICA|nr:PREDICTED: uncharacterized protein LOC660485 isoform X2 [Tribolium castaneum]EFA05123.1 hypothetical protein TcasGA2_TC015238 [Tribolium castaneum]|eukprot:XP_971806.1 PREDICTED: uncharacterized protein LOC660485 isoform X2 [Tribolium castaneum]
MTEIQEKSTDENTDNKNSITTISSKLSTDQLICKSPQESNSSVKSLEKIIVGGDDGSLLCLGLLQFIFGFLMVVFGGLVLQYDASLSQLGAGIWAGCLAMATGIVGILASAREWCPLKSTPQKITHTIFLALSLVSLAISQLVVALAATGSARDINNSEFDEEVEVATTPVPPGKISIILPVNYMSIVSNLGLLAVSVAEFVVAAVASYRSSRILCPCFRKKGEFVEDLNAQRNALVSSWLGKHSPPPLYVVAAPASTLGKGSKASGGLPVPVFALPHHQMVPPRAVPYPLIPAPLGTIPSPIIPPDRDLLRRKKKHFYSRCPPRDRARSKSKSKEKSVTEEDVVRTYTGLDKAIAEEFIDICDSRNVSLCSDESCTSSCQRSCNGCNISDGASREYLVNNSKT